ncbi:MAG TPA: gamma-glutamyl-gamma-aminobutyrate hydrolase family protein [Bacteriovoracaceae bacterium]|nr:gamma-glutamyl-gamma-aminobutyrate hydrolase family protein [Bacteriovoracaceae bacterium]
MLKQILIRVLVFALTYALSAGAILAGETVTIGCTIACSGPYGEALRKLSKALKIPLEVIDLSKNRALDLAKLDGIVIPGGVDIDPKYYLSEVEEDLRAHTRRLDHLVNYSNSGKKRDPFEFKLLKSYFNDQRLRDLPVLGVCRGMQMLAVSQGIPLYVDINKELELPNRRNLHDKIHLGDEESLMKQLFPAMSFLGFKQHHQGIRVDYYLKHESRWPEVRVTAFSNQKLIAESLEFTNRPVLGIQFHPEKDFTVSGQKIFGWLLQKSALRNRGRRP